MAKTKSKVKTARKRSAAAPLRPRPKQQPQQPPQAKRNPLSVVKSSMRSLRVYDPFLTSGDVPISTFEGEAKGVNGAVRSVQDVLQDPVLLCIGTTGHSATVVSRIKVSASPTRTTLKVSYLDNEGPGYPTSGRAMRLGCRIQNVSKRLDMQGRIFVLNTNKRQELPAVPSDMTQAQWLDLIASIRVDPRTRTFNGSSLETPVKAYSAPHDDVDYHDYRGWTAPEDMNQHMSHFTSGPGTSTSAMPMSCIWVVMDELPIGEKNSYNYTVLAGYYTRWASAEVMSSMMKPPPLADLSMVNHQKATAHIDGQPRPDSGKTLAV